MDASQIIKILGGTNAVARRLGVKPPSVSEWKKTRIPDDRLLELAAEIEAKSNGAVHRWSLRPTDWWQIWPELVGAPGAPALPGVEPSSVLPDATVHEPDVAEAPRYERAADTRQGDRRQEERRTGERRVTGDRRAAPPRAEEDRRQADRRREDRREGDRRKDPVEV
jgi:DNA-binding transcriptional regulator YdaS (Cro superfamily)